MSVVRLTRRVTFSSGHRYWDDKLDAEANRALFGKWSSPYNHGHNYVLWATYVGEPDTHTGMVVNIKDLDQVLQEQVVARFDQKSINDEVSEMAGVTPSLENLAKCVCALLLKAAPRTPEARFEELRLDESETLYAETRQDKGEWKLTLTRAYEFAASHRLYNEALPEAANWELYGKCANPGGHGHNYKLEVTVSGAPNPKTGMIVRLEELDEAVARLVVDRYDHHNLTTEVAELHGKVTTSEVVAKAIWNALEGRLPAKLTRVRLFETERNVFEVGGD